MSNKNNSPEQKLAWETNCKIKPVSKIMVAREQLISEKPLSKRDEWRIKVERNKAMRRALGMRKDAHIPVELI